MSNNNYFTSYINGERVQFTEANTHLWSGQIIHAFGPIATYLEEHLTGQDSTPQASVQASVQTLVHEVERVERNKNVDYQALALAILVCQNAPKPNLNPKNIKVWKGTVEEYFLSYFKHAFNLGSGELSHDQSLWWGQIKDNLDSVIDSRTTLLGQQVDCVINLGEDNQYVICNCFDF